MRDQSQLREPTNVILLRTFIERPTVITAFSFINLSRSGTLLQQGVVHGGTGGTIARHFTGLALVSLTCPLGFERMFTTLTHYPFHTMYLKEPCPVEWYEYFYVVGLTVIFSSFADQCIMPRVKKALLSLKRGTDSNRNLSIESTLCVMIEKMTGIEPELDSTLEECGLASVGLPILVGRLNECFSNEEQPLRVTTQDLINTRTISDMVEVVKAARCRMEHDGVQNMQYTSS